jgi:NAD-dependent dihydropyrimidine dehydrogenase PreA subunit
MHWLRDLRKHFPVGVYEMKDGKSVPTKASECLVCRACEAQCPEGAIQVIE